MMKHTRPAIAAIVLLVVALLAVPTTAAAQIRAAARSVATATTATWGAVSTAPGSPAKVGGQAKATVQGWSSSPDYFDVVNVGTVPLTEQRIGVSTVALGFLGGYRDPSQTLIACTNGSWSRDRCSGTEVKLHYIGGLEFILATAIKPGERVTVQLTNKGQTAWTLVTTISVSVTHDDVRAATVTHT